jgi:hypothetical protein
MRDYQLSALMGWEATLLFLAPSLASWLIVTCVYIDNSKPKYIPKRLRLNRYIGRLRSIFENFGHRLLTAISEFIEGLPTTRRRMRPPAGIRFTCRASQTRKRTRARQRHRPGTQLLSICLSAKKSGKKSTPDRYDSDSYLLAIDNCCSKCMTNNKADFIGPLTKVDVKIKGINGTSQSSYRGTVKWSFDDSDGRRHDHFIPGTYYCPGLPCRLLSPQHWAQTKEDNLPKKGGAICETLDDGVTLRWSQRRFTLTVPLDPASNVAYIRTSAGFSKFQAYSAFVGEADGHIQCYDTHVIPPDVDDSPSDTSPPSKTTVPVAAPPVAAPQRTPEGATSIDFDDLPDAPNLIERDDLELENSRDELYRWHLKLGHISFSRLKIMALKGDIPKRLASCRVPMCAACQYGKLTRKPWRTKEKPSHSRPITAPGQSVSVDQLESVTPGFYAQMKGWLTAKRYRAATVFVDQYSGFTYVHLQTSTNGDETLAAKHAFEILARSYGVEILHYHGDNGRFAENKFVTDIKAGEPGQGLNFCAVNHHSQNPYAEKRIRDLQEQARTNLLHAQKRWPKAISVHLWPYALRTTAAIDNTTPRRKDAQTPIELFSGTRIAPQLRNFHHFGCPVYQLNSNLATGKSLNKWKSRAQLGIYLGPSPRHARSVALVLNPLTGLVSPQYHCKFDNFFETVRPSVDSHPLPIEWQVRAGFAPDPISGRYPKFWQPPTADVPPSKATNSGSATRNHVSPLAPAANEGGLDDFPLEANEGDWENEGVEGVNPPDNGPLDNGLTIQPPGTQPPPEPPPWNTNFTTTRSGRLSKPGPKATESREQRASGLVVWLTSVEIDLKEDDFEAFSMETYLIEKEMEDPIAFSATSDADTLYYHQAMQAPDKAQFRLAMEQEVDDHEAREHWTVIPKKDVPYGTRILQAVWSFKRKRRIDTREVYKRKARLTAHGGQQVHGVNYWETYAPVVTWTSIRFFLIISLLSGWHTQQIDFVLAFPQAKVECDIFMEAPIGFNFKAGLNKKTHCLKLLQNLYGTKQGAKIWYDHLHAGLTKLHYKRSTVDKCVFYNGKSVFLVYTDDGIFLGPDLKEINRLKAELVSKGGFKIEDMGDLNEYLGVKVTKTDDGKIKLAQPHLIAQIIEDLHLQDDTHCKTTPANSSTILERDLNQEPMNGDFDYRSVIGKLNFLEKSTRPDIAFAVHQCARFSSNPRITHARAVRRIGKYLKGTADKGLLLAPTQHSFVSYVDADFCGLWNPETAMFDTLTSKSRTGFVVNYAGCPLTWASRMQTETALSTTEAEYMALSENARTLIPLMDLLEEGKDHGVPIYSTQPTVRCMIFEDNAGALELANVPKMRPRTRHINQKYHHFRAHVKSGRFKVLAVDTKDQLADQFTKGLGTALFQDLRKRVMGW